jgi:hypothetical protein
MPQDQSPTNAYEAIKQSDLLSPALKEGWIKLDQMRRNLRDAYRGLEKNEDLNSDAKTRRAQAEYDRLRPLIEDGARHLKEDILAAARTYEKSSHPRLKDYPINTSDVNQLLAAQSEGDRIVRKITARKNQGGPFRVDVSGELQKEYQRGLEQGGVEGASIIRGVHRACDELGVSVDEIANSLRSDRQRAYLDTARRLEQYTDSIESLAPKPPKTLGRRSTQEVGQNMRPPPFLSNLGGGSPPIAAQEPGHSTRSSKKRKASWK